MSEEFWYMLIYFKHVDKKLDFIMETGWSWNAFWQKRESNYVPRKFFIPNETVFRMEKKILKLHATNVDALLIQYVIATHLKLLSRISFNFIV